MQESLFKRAEFVKQVNLTAFIVLLCRSLEGVVSFVGITHVALIFLVSMLGFISYILLSFSVVWHGIRIALPVMIAACVPSLIQGMLSGSSVIIWALPVGVVLSITILAECFRCQKAWSLGIECNILFIVAVMCILHALFPDIAQWWADTMRFDPALLGTLTVQQRAEISQFFEFWPKIQTGYMGGTWMLYLPIFVVWFSKRWIDILDASRLQNVVRGIRIGRILAGVGLILMLMAVLTSMPILIDLMPIWFMIFALVGLSLVHDTVASIPSKALILCLVYTVCLLLPQWALSILMLMGCIDCIANIRPKLIKRFST